LKHLAILLEHLAPFAASPLSSFSDESGTRTTDDHHRRRRGGGNVRNFSKTTKYGRKGGPRARTSRVLRRSTRVKKTPPGFSRYREGGGRRYDEERSLPPVPERGRRQASIFCPVVPRRLCRSRRDFYCVYGVNAAPSGEPPTRERRLYLVKSERVDTPVGRLLPPAGDVTSSSSRFVRGRPHSARVTRRLDVFPGAVSLNLPRGWRSCRYRSLTDERGKRLFASTDRLFVGTFRRERRAPRRGVAPKFSNNETHRCV